jgi:fatty acid desaturase
MAPVLDELPDVLPTSSLRPGGQPQRDLRAKLRAVPDARNALAVASAWVQISLVVYLSVRIDRWWVWPLAVILMGRGFALLGILTHEAAHRLLFARKRANDWAGRWLLGYPAFNPFDIYRRVHMAHHRDELGPNEPDLALYSGYPITRDSFARKLLRDAVGISGWKNLKPLLQAAFVAQRRRVALSILAAQGVLLLAFSLAGWPQLYLVLWLLPWMTSWRVINRLRAIAEHGGMENSPDKRMTTHVVRQRALARFFMVPHNAGYHLAHHVDPGIPLWRLPELHHELESSGWIGSLEWSSYLRLWRAMSAG